MNKKFITLLAGALLMLATVFSVSAQYTPVPPSDLPSSNSTAGSGALSLEGQQLKLGAPVQRLQLGGNDFYHLNVVGVIINDPGNITNPPYFPGSSVATPDVPDPTEPDWVLYLGAKQEFLSGVWQEGQYPLFIDRLGLARGHAAVSPKYGNVFNSGSKAEESAAALWCTVVNDYNQGQNITFDFTNKQQKNQLLEVDVNDYPDYRLTTNPWGASTTFSGGKEYIGPSVVPGSISAWEFSPSYISVYEGRPLVSYITTDTVAVLCLNDNDAGAFVSAAGGQILDVMVKIVSANDVKNNRVKGMLFFTLREAMPFILDATDFNTMFGTDEDPDFRKLKFDPTSAPKTGANANPNFFEDGLAAQYIPDFYAGEISRFFPSYIGEDPVNAGDYDVMLRSSLWLDQMGYMFLYRNPVAANNGADYLYVQHRYQNDNVGGSQYLKLGFREVPNIANTLNFATAIAPAEGAGVINDIDDLVVEGALGGFTADSIIRERLLIGQTVWRLVYYPSGDSIYINPYSATYLPTFAPQVMTNLGLTDTPDDWYDIKAQAENYFTYRANYYKLDQVVIPTTPAATAFAAAEPTAPQAADLQVARLKRGVDPNKQAINSHGAFRNHHKLYVEIQNLETREAAVVTLGNGYANGTISTHINFGNYSECKEGNTKTDRVTIASDLYLIRNNDGYYLRIPLHSAKDSAEWWKPEADEHPEFLPSYQWIVLKRYESSTTSQITFYNREFDGTHFDNIQLMDGEMETGFKITGYAPWDKKSVNGSATTFANDDKTSTFIALPNYIKSDSLLGYTFIPRDVAQVNVYSLNFAHAYDQNRYIDWKGDYWKYPSTDTTVYVTGQGSYDRLYFKLDTQLIYDLEPYGFIPGDSKYASSYKIPNLKRLYRQPYYLNLEDPYKLLCTNLYGFQNGTQGEYAIGSKERTMKLDLGIPMFNLRNTYHKLNDAGEWEAYFALVQRINKPGSQQSDLSNFENYLTKAWNSKIATEVIDAIQLAPTHSDNDYWRTGVFVAGVDNQTAKLKAMLRADEATTVSTFRLVKDEDPLYRRFDQLGIDYDDPTLDKDAPKVLKFYWMDRPSYEMFENTGALAGQVNYWQNYGIGTTKTEGKKNYLGYVNINQYKDAPTAILVDTAFIKRGTGPVKPQYLLLVDPSTPDGTIECDPDGNFFTVSENYLRGRYLINATDSARGVAPEIAGLNNLSVRATGSVTDPTTHDKNGLPIGRSYLWENNWERLIFTDAIHAYDYDALYLVEGVDLTPYMYDSGVIDLKKLDAASADSTAAVSTSKPIRKIFLGNNDHKDAVFQMRLIERNAKQFMIESETGEPNDLTINNNRKWGYSYGQLNSYGPMIAPCVGGWIKEQGGTAVISRSDMITSIADGLKMDVRMTTDFPSANEPVVAAAPTVIGGNNAITILGAAGKKVTVSNILGQTVAGVVLSSDNATISAPKGVVVVAIEGEAAVKTLVK